MDERISERRPKQVNQYDKVLKENIEVILPGLMKHLMGIEAELIDTLSDGVQHTRERKPDVLKKVTDRSGQAFILHIEFQSRSDPDMVCRMAEYYIMLWRKYRLPVSQFVIYISEGKPDMPVELRHEKLSFRYDIISLMSVDYKLFLRSPRPEEKMMALLADFGKQDPTEVVGEIAQQVLATSNGSLNSQRYLQQMRILANLRTFISSNSFDMLWGDITRYILEETDITRDPLYRKGEEVGKEAGIAAGIAERNLEVTKKLLKLGQFTTAQIADLVGVSEDFVLEVKSRRKKPR